MKAHKAGTYRIPGCRDAKRMRVTEPPWMGHMSIAGKLPVRMPVPSFSWMD